MRWRIGGCVVLALLVMGCQHRPPDLKINIVGGDDAGPGEFPWQVSLVKSGKEPRYGHQCGGVLIAPRWVLTAAHCANKWKDATKVYVLSGTHDLSQGGVRHKVDVIRKHEKWTPGNPQNDIALLRLTGDAAAWIALAATDLNPGDQATVTGWGATVHNGMGTDVLQNVEVPIVDNAVCNKAYGGRITPEMLCAGKKGKDACQRDSGGPLVDLQSTPRLIGIVIAGTRCAEDGFPGIYTRVTKYLDWIKQYSGVTP